MTETANTETTGTTVPIQDLREFLRQGIKLEVDTAVADPKRPAGRPLLESGQYITSLNQLNGLENRDVHVAEIITASADVVKINFVIPESSKHNFKHFKGAANAVRPLKALIQVGEETESSVLNERLDGIIDEGLTYLQFPCLKYDSNELKFFDAYKDFEKDFQERTKRLELLTSQRPITREYVETHAGNGLSTLAQLWFSAEEGYQDYRRAVGTVILAMAMGNKIEKTLPKRLKEDYKRDQRKIALGTFLVPIAKRMGEAADEIGKTPAYQGAYLLAKHGFRPPVTTIVKCSDNGYSKEEAREKHIGIRLCIAANKAYDEILSR